MPLCPEQVVENGGLSWRELRPDSPGGLHISDRLTVNLITQTCPRDTVRNVHRLTNSASHRRNLPAEAMVYHVIAMAFIRVVSVRKIPWCLVDGLPCLGLGWP